MALKLFGFTIGRDDSDKVLTSQSFTVPELEDGISPIASGAGAYGTFLDLEGTVKNEFDLVSRYRQMSLQPECETAIDDIINEIIVDTGKSDLISLNLESLNIGEKVKTQLRDEFRKILRLMDFRNQGYDIFKRWYVDGRIHYHLVIDPESPDKGITEMRLIDALKIKKVRETMVLTSQEQDKMRRMDIGVPKTQDYFMYNPQGFYQTGGASKNNTIRVAQDAIGYATSGLMDGSRKMVIGYLHKAIKPLNNLRMIEDAQIIYRVSRAPERRIFYVDVGNLPKIKAEQYMRDIMNRYKNKLVYDSSTGEVRDDRKFQSILEDFWLPRREGGRGTEISTLPGGENLAEIEDILFFQKKLYKALNVPLSRMNTEESGQAFFGRASEITRDELKFAKFLDRIRARFNNLFYDVLKKQCLLKGICNKDDWDKMRDYIYFNYETDSHFDELKYAELMEQRLNLVGQAIDHKGSLLSIAEIRKKMMRQTEDDIERIDNEIQAEKDAGMYDQEDDGF
mgnify:CR=1 FL=1|tara:strand:- start:6445 stop:7974 length:1530 start_codon:yes stop_codon:yes gene_type:complete